jgi:hypothetical protein
MDRSGQIGTDRNVLMRIAALLLSLADLAERAAGLPFLRRRHVLGILGFGEAEARAFLLEVSTGAPASADAPGQSGDAALLAARLRALALALLLCVVQARAAFPGAAAARAVRRPREMSGPAVRRPDARALPAPDTS